MSLPATVKYVTFMKVESSSYLKIRLDILFSVYVVFVVAVIVRYAWAVWTGASRRGPRGSRRHAEGLRPMNLTSPFSLSIVAIVGLSLLGLPVGHAMIGGSILYLYAAGLDMGTAAEQLLNGMYTSFLLLAIPLFVLAAEFMNTGSIMDRLLRFCNAIVGRFRGGLAHVNVVQSIIFASMSGSALADAASSGKLMQSLMTRDGKYPPAYAAALTAVSSVIGPIMPPSIPLVLYALVSDTSVGYLFLGGVIPGLLLGVVQMGLIAFTAKRRNFPVEAPVPLRELPRITWEAFPALMMPVILLGCLYSGITTPTEAAAVAAAYALLISALLYRSISPKDVYVSLRTSARITVSIGMLIAGALVFNYVITVENIPRTLSAILKAYEMSPLVFLLAVNVAAADPRLLPRGDDDHPGHPAGAAAHRAGAGHRSGALRRDGGDEHHARAGDAALRPAAVHDVEDHGGSAARHRARGDAVPLRHDRCAGADHAVPRPRSLPAAAARVYRLTRHSRAGVAATGPLWREHATGCRRAAMLLSFDIAAEAQLEHDDWHSHEHLPERLAIPGFRARLALDGRWPAGRPTS